MNAAEYKEIEGQRIQQVLGALPAAMLVFGESPSTSAGGAPLFAAAIALIVGALMNWNYTDGAYYLDSISYTVPDEEREALDRWEADLLAAGYRFQHRTYSYAILSLFCSILGVAGVYSTLHTGISVNIGFGLAFVAAALVSFDIVRLGMTRNALLRECRRLAGTATI